ncbi:MAG: autotransporter-associated beta strand repeat-containing protein [Gemmataceae bacterium]
MAMHSLRTNALFATLLTLTCCGTLNAQTWNGSTGNWSVDSNWAGGFAPISSASTILTFSGNTSYTATNDFVVAFELNQLNFTGDGTGNALGKNIIDGNRLRFAGTSAQIHVSNMFSPMLEIQSDIDFASNTEIIPTKKGLFLSGALSGSADITVNGGGTGVLALTGYTPSTFSGHVTISSGHLAIESDVRLGYANVTLANQSTIEFQQPMATSRTYILTGDYNTIYTDSEVTMVGQLTGSSDIHKEGYGTLILRNTQNDFSGVIQISSGTLKLGSSDALPQNSGITLSANSVFDTDGYSPSIKTLNGGSPSGMGYINNSGTSMTVGTGTNVGDKVGFLQAPIYGRGALIKNGDGFFELAAESTYSGGTIINQGTVIVSNSSGTATGSGDVSLATLATLAGDGRIMGKVTGSGTISPSRSTSSLIGKLSLDGGLNLNTGTGGKYIWNLGQLSESNPGIDFDQISIAGGDLTLGGSSKLTLEFVDSGVDPNSTDPFWDSPHIWTIIDVNNSETNFFNNTFSEITNPTYSTGSFTLLDPADFSGDIVLSFTPNPVPEPAFILTATILGAIGGQVLRKRSKGKNRD